MTKKSSSQTPATDDALERVVEVRKALASVTGDLAQLATDRTQATKRIGRLEADRRLGRDVDEAEEHAMRRTVSDAGDRIASLRATATALRADLAEALESAEKSAEADRDAARAKFHAAVVRERAALRKALLDVEPRLRRLVGLSTARLNYLDDGARSWADGVALADPENPGEALWAAGRFNGRPLAALDPDDLESIKPTIEELRSAEDHFEAVAAEAARSRNGSE